MSKERPLFSVSQRAEARTSDARGEGLGMEKKTKKHLLSRLLYDCLLFLVFLGLSPPESQGALYHPSVVGSPLHKSSITW